MIKRRLLKIVFSLIIIGFGLVGFLSIGQTYAFFSDGVDSNGNIFTAGTLDLTLRSGQGNFSPSAENMQRGDQVNRDIYIGKTSISSPLQYRVSYELIGGNEDFCNQLQLKIWYNHYHGPVIGGYDNRDMRLKYNEQLTSLVDLIDEDFIIPHSDDQFDEDLNDGTEQWFYYSIILPSTIDDIYQGQVCNFNFVVEAWQDNIGNYGDGGFTDVEEIENTIKVGYWNPPVVLNEFLPNAENYPEFIEIYNNTSLPIDLNGFYIKANGNIIPIDTITTSAYSGGSTIIPANGWLVVTTGGDKIDDSSGTIALYSLNDIEVDSYSYDVSDYYILEPTPGDPNDKIPAGSLPTEIPADKSFARIPDGSPNWVDPIPTPGTPNKLEEEIEELEPELEQELLLEEIIEEIPLITATTTTSTIPDIDILENSTSTSTTIPEEIIPKQTTATTTEPLVAGVATSTTTVPMVEEPITTTTTTEPPAEESDLTTATTTESLIEETTTTTTTISEETITTTTTTEPPVEEDFITTTTTTEPPTTTTTTATVPEITTTTTTEPPIEESPATTTTTQPPVSTDAEVDDLTAINLINIYFT